MNVSSRRQFVTHSECHWVKENFVKSLTLMPRPANIRDMQIFVVINFRREEADYSHATSDQYWSLSQRLNYRPYGWRLRSNTEAKLKIYVRLNCFQIPFMRITNYKYSTLQWIRFRLCVPQFIAQQRCVEGESLLINNSLAFGLSFFFCKTLAIM